MNDKKFVWCVFYNSKDSGVQFAEVFSTEEKAKNFCNEMWNIHAKDYRHVSMIIDPDPYQY